MTVVENAVSVAAEQRRAQKAMWGAAAAAWDRWFSWYVTNFQPVFDWCAEAINAGPGMRVLDIACGAGQPALTLSTRVGASGHVDAVDMSPEMIAAAERRANSLGSTNLQFHEMDAESLAFGDAIFDGVTCVCGLMFCPDPSAALAEIQRVLKPGGRFAVVVWDEPAKNQFSSVIGRAAAEVLKAPPPAPNAPQAFRFERAQLADLMREAAAVDLTIDSRPMFFDYENVENYLEITTDLAGALKAKLATLTHDDLERFKTLVRANAAPYVSGDRLRLLATPVCVTGRRGPR
jgi:SAM-dependent methyltransferase